MDVAHGGGQRVGERVRRAIELRVGDPFDLAEGGVIAAGLEQRIEMRVDVAVEDQGEVVLVDGWLLLVRAPRDGALDLLGMVLRVLGGRPDRDAATVPACGLAPPMTAAGRGDRPFVGLGELQRRFDVLLRMPSARHVDSLQQALAVVNALGRRSTEGLWKPVRRTAGRRTFGLRRFRSPSFDASAEFSAAGDRRYSPLRGHRAV